MGTSRRHDHRQRRARVRPAGHAGAQDVPEQQALDIVLRDVSGYLVAPRETAVDRRLGVRPHLHPADQLTRRRPPPPHSAAAAGGAAAIQDDLDDDDAPLPTGARGRERPGREAAA